MELPLTSIGTWAFHSLLEQRAPWSGSPPRVASPPTRPGTVADPIPSPGADTDDEEVVIIEADATALPEGAESGQPASPQLPSLAKPTSAATKNDLLSYYLAEVRRYPLLEPEEEKSLAIRYQESGDSEAAHALVTANLRLVVKLAFQYHRQWSNVLDLIQEGNVGLVEALNRYDPYRGILLQHAQYWIRAMILRFLMHNYRLVRPHPLRRNVLPVAEGEGTTHQGGSIPPRSHCPRPSRSPSARSSSSTTPLCSCAQARPAGPKKAVR